MTRFFFYCTALFLGLSLTGCGGSEITVFGTVQFDGTPVENGRILFRKTEGDQKAFSGLITNGSYSVPCEPGSMRVEITASRIVPGKFDTSNDTKEPVGEMYIPAKYNTKSELTAEVSSGNRQHSFDLKSK